VDAGDLLRAIDGKPVNGLSLKVILNFFFFISLKPRVE